MATRRNPLCLVQCKTCPHNEVLPRSDATSVCPKCGNSVYRRTWNPAANSRLADSTSQLVPSLPLALRLFLEGSRSTQASLSTVSAATSIPAARLRSIRRGFSYTGPRRYPVKLRPHELASLAAYFSVPTASIEAALRLSWIRHAHKLGATMVPTHPHLLRNFLPALYKNAP